MMTFETTVVVLVSSTSIILISCFMFHVSFSENNDNMIIKYSKMNIINDSK